MSEREELASAIENALLLSRGIIAWTGAAQEDIADAILAAGYRKPRTITTAEERSLLLPGTIGMDSLGNAWKRGAGSWVSTGGDTGPLYDEDDITLTILHEPEPQP